MCRDSGEPFKNLLLFLLFLFDCFQWRRTGIWFPITGFCEGWVFVARCLEVNMWLRGGCRVSRVGWSINASTMYSTVVCIFLLLAPTTRLALPRSHPTKHLVSTPSTFFYKLPSSTLSFDFFSFFIINLITLQSQFFYNSRFTLVPISLQLSLNLQSLLAIYLNLDTPQSAKLIN